MGACVHEGQLHPLTEVSVCHSQGMTVYEHFVHMHTHIVTHIHISTHTHTHTQYIPGGTLESLLQDKSFMLLWSLRLQLALDISKGMEYLHNNGMLHRDLNSRNVLLRKAASKYTAVVADFGLAAKSPRHITLANAARK